ncbi:formylglycine-generating enzyme family protein [Aquimarina gracilis]|uniref:Formylglycine-generating enzyme family protein n=1 Tax=Aquimarina gracilis TaxID=874422 RepID=A0ABU5ZRS6_9FLAO|nr:formylglycine-generating enzyme family protein [Aquimarina gracilis]MEB3344739.1 formylglycine-generating enzyme family protein [Aquimarina gracilis]
MIFSTTKKIKKSSTALCASIFIIFIGCFQERKEKNTANQLKSQTILITSVPEGIIPPKGMIWVPGKKFRQGAVPQDSFAMHHEKPAHAVAVDGFFIDITEVTNSHFKKFVESTGYITMAEREIDWEEIKKQLPVGTQKPADSILHPGSLVFKKVKSQLPNLFDYSQWWEWKIGANWKNPKGPGSTIEGKDNYPVVHIAFEDAMAYCKWANRRLPTEAEWELASKGLLLKSIYNWGDSDDTLSEKANTWQGSFPDNNTLKDGFQGIAPVKSFPPNSIGLYDMAGNVWEWTQDWYDPKYYSQQKKLGLIYNPKGSKKSYNPQNPLAKERVIKGGSFLCNKSYCTSYRNSARMASSYDSSTEHIGFRTVVSVDMLQSQTKN